MGWLGLLFDAGLAVLLIVTIGYCSRLSARIRLLQDSRGELAGMIGQFDQATERAMASLADLQQVSKRIGDALQLKIEKANFLADDLAFLIEKSAKLATQLEGKKPAVEAIPVKQPAPDLRSSVKPQPGVEYTQAEPEAKSQTDSIASLEALINRLSSPVSSGAPTKATFLKPMGQVPARTQAERDLYEALKGG